MSIRAPSNSPQIEDADDSSVVPVVQPYMRKDIYDQTGTEIVDNSELLGGKSLSDIENDISTKLPLSGGVLTGPLLTTTVDARNISLDGAKLDTIESGAEINQTAIELLNSLLTVDGPNSLLDADTLDGKQLSTIESEVASSIAAVTPTSIGLGNVNNTSDLSKTTYGPISSALDLKVDTAATTIAGRDIPLDGVKLDSIETNATADQTAIEILTAIKTVDGVGSGLDANLFDGLLSSNYFKSSSISSGTFSTSGRIIAGKGSGGVALTVNDGHGNANLTFNHENGVPDSDGNSARIVVNTDSSANSTLEFKVASGVTSGISVPANTILTVSDSDIKYKNQSILHENSTVDAATLGGFTPLTMPISTAVSINYPTSVDIVSGTVNGETVYHSGQDTGWIVPTLLNGWSSYSSLFIPSGVRYRRYGNGLVEIQIMVKSGLVGQAIAVLPAGFRPINTLITSGLADSASSRIDVYITGEVVVLLAASNFWVAHNIMFKAEV